MRIDEQVETFLKEQRKQAEGRRREMLEKDLTAEIAMLKELILPVLGSLKDVEMEFELVSMTGTRIYADFCLLKYRMILEVEGFVVHAEKVTRQRFDFERMRIRTFAEQGYSFVPFTWDELAKHPEACRRTLYAIIGKLGGDVAIRNGLGVREKEVLRCALTLHRPIRLADVRRFLKLSTPTSRKVLKMLVHKGYLSPVVGGVMRVHAYALTDEGRATIVAASR